MNSQACPVCGGALQGDGFTEPLHCEFANEDIVMVTEADGGPVICTGSDGLGENTVSSRSSTASKPLFQLLKRRQLTAGSFTAPEYYAQFVTQTVLDLVERGLPCLQDENPDLEGEHPSTWSALAMIIKPWCKARMRLADNLQNPSEAELIQVAQQAAYMVRRKRREQK